MRSLAEQLSQYESFHTKYFTKLTHFIGIPLIVFSLMVILGWVHVKIPNFFDTTLAWFISVLVLIYYFFLDITLAAVMTVAFVILNIIARFFSQPAPSMLGLEVFLICFILGWALQFIGHLVERKKPAFMTNVVQLVIAPIYLAAEVFFFFDRKEKLRKKMDEYAKMYTTSE